MDKVDELLEQIENGLEQLDKTYDNTRTFLKRMIAKKRKSTIELEDVKEIIDCMTYVHYQVGTKRGI